MPNQTDDAPQTKSADGPARGLARPTYAGAPARWHTPDPSLLEDIGRPLATVEKLLQRDTAAGASPLQAVRGPVPDGKACPKQQSRRACPEQGRRVVVHDPALAALTRSVAARPSGVLLWCDEPTQWPYAFAREANRGKPRGPFVDAWPATSVLPVSVPRLATLENHPGGALAG